MVPPDIYYTRVTEPGPNGKTCYPENQAAQHRGHWVLLCDEEKSAHVDGQDQLSQVRSGCPQARRFQRNQDQVAAHIFARNVQSLLTAISPAWGRVSMFLRHGQGAYRAFSRRRLAPAAGALPVVSLEGEMVAGVESDIGSGVEVRASPTPACQVMDQRGRWPLTWRSIDPARHHKRRPLLAAKGRSSPHGIRRCGGPESP